MAAREVHTPTSGRTCAGRRQVTKERAPISLDAALARIAGQLPGSWADMARRTGYAERTVRAWGDEDRDEQINLPAAIALDIAYQAAGGAGWPCYEAYGYMIGAAQRDRFVNAFDILQLASIVVRETGQAEAALIDAALPDATPGHRREAQRELIDAMEAMKRALLTLEQVDAPTAPPRITAPP